jgi:phage I-like protein
MNKLSQFLAHMRTPGAELAEYATALDLPAGAKAPDWVQLLPLGRITPSPLDGREPFDLKDAEKVIAASQAFLRTMTIDYDHGTNKKEGSSRAAGWITELASKGPNGESGIWGRVEWTKSGAEAIESREYRFLSPTLFHDRKTREVRFIVRAALTNDPALVLKALASIQTEEQSLDLLKKLAAMLGLDPETATEADVIAAIEALAKNQGMADDLAKKDKALCSIAKAAGQTIADASKIDDTMVAAICARFGGSDEVAALKEQLADARIEVFELRGKKDARTPEEIVDDLVAAGSITPAAKAEALDIYKLSPKKFEAMIEKLGVATLATRHAPEKVPNKGGGSGALDDDARRVVECFGIKEADFVATAKANMKTEETA